MYLSHFGLNEPPFRITPHTDFFFEGANRGTTLEALLYAILHDEGIVKVSGEVGSGKTMLCRVLMERLPGTVETIYLANPSVNRDEILHAIAEELEITVGKARITSLLRTLQDRLIKLHGGGRRVVVLIDEAHAMPAETLEEIRLLSNLETNRHKLLQIVLFGQPELDDQLNTASMRQLKERITHSFRLEPLVRNDIERYIDFRMRAAGYRGPNVFAPTAIRMIANASEGLSRRINILCDKSLLAAFADDVHHVLAKQAKAAIRDSAFYKAAGNDHPRWWTATAGVVAGVALVYAAQFLFPGEAPKNSMPARVNAPAPPMQTVTPQVATSAPVPGTQPAPPGLSPGTAKPAASGPVAAVPVIPARSASTESAPIQVAAPPKAAAAPVAPVAAETNASAAADGPPKSAPTGMSPTPPASGTLTRARFAATQQWLPSAAVDQYSIQLLSASYPETHRIEDLLLRVSSHKLEITDFYVYSVKINDQQHYRVSYGLYPTTEATNRAIRQLPSAYLARSPFQRSVGRMRSQNQQ